MKTKQKIKIAQQVKKHRHVILYFIVFLFLPLQLFSQRYVEIGVLGGAMYYMGDVNPYRHLYKPQMAYGGVAKMVINKHYSYRLSVTKGKVAGSDSDFSDVYRNIRAHEFITSITDISLLTEFNFMPLLMKPHKDAWRNHATYVTGGVSLFIGPNSPAISSHFTIPFGIGYKYVASKTINIAAEWLFHTTFNDQIDQLGATFNNEYAGKQQTFTSNNDSFGMLGIAITYKFKRQNNQCPAYGTKNGKKKYK